MQEVAFNGGRGQTQGQILSPEPTTDDMLRKCWYRTSQGIIELIKGTGEGDEVRYVVAREPLCEYYMPQVAQTMGLDCVVYGLEKGIGEWGRRERFSTCPLFTSQEVGFLAIWECLPYEVLKKRGFDFDYEKLRQAIEAVMGKQAFSDLMLFDAIIGNIDRHLGNFGMFVNNDTNELIKPAPIFDNGWALFNFLNRWRIENYFHLHHSQPYYFKSSLGYYFDRLVKMHATPKSLELCDKLQDFTFTPHPKYRPSRGLIKACSEVVRQRAKDAKRV
ncbi:hypothetical protein, partial [Helicobacter ailurogastricus]|uniref:hypothetical protein n=1 Tax=Helicobacter ailurogastricus TaxID=1578720 RepID=UPI0025549755